MGNEQPFIDIGGVRYVVDASKITIEEWLEVTLLVAEDRREEAGTRILKMVMKALGPAAHSLPIIYLSVLVPRVTEILMRSIMPEDLDNELDEILNRLPPTEG